MIQTPSKLSHGRSNDALDQYVVSVRKLNLQFQRIQHIENETAGSLSRAAAALRSIASSRVQARSGSSSPW